MNDAKHTPKGAVPMEGAKGRGDEGAMSPEEAAALLERTSTSVRRATDPSTSILFAAWAISWTIGYVTIWYSTKDQVVYTGPPAWASITMGLALAAALVVTIVVISKAVHGIEGMSATAGKYYAATWPLVFIAWFAIMSGAVRLGASDTMLGFFSAIIPALLVATIYCASAAQLGRSMFVVGAWLAVTVAIAAQFDVRTLTLVMGVLGGLGFAVGAIIGRSER
ncbi:hypothetical protein [Janibacter sp. GXQ6167]|uniref:hypothetical protein n=1 Tax=Janibacter sp. GXQ6167 TaxID=3240791 RepID=UPI0035266E8C